MFLQQTQGSFHQIKRTPLPPVKFNCRDTMDCAGEDARDAVEMVAVGAATEAEISLGCAGRCNGWITLW